jgi:hypothetical protein
MALLSHALPRSRHGDPIAFQLLLHFKWESSVVNQELDRFGDAHDALNEIEEAGTGPGRLTARLALNSPLGPNGRSAEAAKGSVRRRDIGDVGAERLCARSLLRFWPISPFVREGVSRQGDVFRIEPFKR